MNNPKQVLFERETIICTRTNQIIQEEKITRRYPLLPNCNRNKLIGWGNTQETQDIFDLYHTVASMYKLVKICPKSTLLIKKHYQSKLRYKSIHIKKYQYVSYIKLLYQFIPKILICHKVGWGPTKAEGVKAFL